MLLTGYVFYPVNAFCRLSAEADLNYINYDSKSNTEHTSARSLSQQYSVLYEKAGNFANGRFGAYNVALGYEWLTFDTGIKSAGAPQENLGGSRGHIFYRGDILIDPKEIPLKLNLYSRDLAKSSFSTTKPTGSLITNNTNISPFSSSNSPNANAGLTNTSRINRYVSIPSNFPGSISNGSHFESGATLIMGVKNGMTNGYNEVLRHFPMLMLDYKDEINKDRSAIFPIDNRLSRLAFVSLNKKDNWFHYRYITYDDYIDKNNNYKETQIQLGTVDQMLARRWIDFSNWLSISADGQLTKRVNVRQADNNEEFSLNFFGTARREKWEVRSFNNFMRLNENNANRITYKTSVPVYASGLISQTADWNAYTKYNENHTDKGVNFSTVASGYSIEALKKSNFNLTQGLGVEKIYSSSDNSDSLVLMGNVGSASTSRFSRDLSLKTNYSIRNYQYNNNNSSSSFTDQSIRGAASYNISNSLRMTASQLGRLTTGTSQTIMSPIANVSISSAQYESPRANITNAGSSSYQSVSTIGFGWNPLPRLNVGLTVSEDIFVPEVGSRSIITKVDNTVDYAVDKLKITSKNSYVSGNQYETGVADQFNSSNTANYIFSRNVDAKVGVAYFRTVGTANQLTMINFEQGLNYNYYQVSGFARKLFEINESFTSVEEINSNGITTLGGILSASNTTKQRVNTLLMGAKYYPLRQLIVSGGARYLFLNGFENDTVHYFGSLGLKFKLLEASIDYTYGKNKSDNRVEKRFSANVKKRF